VYVDVTYRFPIGSDPMKMGTKLAVGQTAGSWGPEWEHRSAAFHEHLARVIATSEDADDRPTATVRFPGCDIEGDVGSLLTLIFGKFSMAGPAKVTAVALPPDFGRRPRCGMAGLRARLGVPERPLVMAIFKPALGLSATEHGDILREVGLAGIDLVKDDEIMADLPSAPTFERLDAGRRALDEVERRTGHRPLYAVNCTAFAGSVPDTARALVARGAEALLLNGLAYGVHAIEQARDAVDVPILLHPALAGALCGAPDHGLSYSALLGTLAAHTGVDAVLSPAHYGNMPLDHSEEAGIRDALRARGVAPVPSAGIHPGIVPRALGDYGSDVVLNAGTGIMDHPDGPAAGVRAFHEAIERHAAGLPFDPVGLPAGPLKRAVEKWGHA
jgi:2,3-diketo-5-methylthiopentyl-1-phosphate enolase